MPFNIPKLDLDITGININNKIIDEPHTLSGNINRSIAPNYGPFFAESLVLRSGSAILVRGQDYQIVELHQEATLRYGKEIASVILVINTNIPSGVTITYQALGGHFAYNSTAVANMYETVLQDNRPVSFENIFNKPSEYPPTIHRHLLDDVFGFEPVVDSLERIKRAITMGQVDVVLNIIDNLVSKFDCIKASKAFPINKYMAVDHVLYFLSQKKILSNFSVKTPRCSFYKGTVIELELDISLLPSGTDLYWELYNPNGAISSFKEVTGIFNTAHGSSFRIYIPMDIFNNSLLYLGIRLDPNKDDFDAVTYRIDIKEAFVSNNNYGDLFSCEYLDIGSFNEDISKDEELRLYYSYGYLL